MPSQTLPEPVEGPDSNQTLPEPVEGTQTFPELVEGRVSANPRSDPSRGSGNVVDSVHTARGLSRHPAAIVFDNDGLLVDSETCWHEAERSMFTRRGLTYPDALRAEVLGKSVPATAILLAPALGEVGRESALVDEMLTAVADAIAADVVPMPGAVELVRHLHGRMPIAVASNSPRYLVELALDRTGLRPFFEVVVSRDDVAAGKPAPIYTSRRAHDSARSRPSRWLSKTRWSAWLSPSRDAGGRRADRPMSGFPSRPGGRVAS